MTYKLIRELIQLGYVEKMEVKDRQLFYPRTNLLVMPKDLFYIDAGFSLSDAFVFAINFPQKKLKAHLTVTLEEYISLEANGYTQHFTQEWVSYQDNNSNIRIQRQYGMRKITKNEFDFNRYELRQGFPDFPPCPFDHQFKSLGYDNKLNEYVRFNPSIMKDEKLIVRTYN